MHAKLRKPCVVVLITIRRAWITAGTELVMAKMRERDVATRRGQAHI